MYSLRTENPQYLNNKVLRFQNVNKLRGLYPDQVNLKINNPVTKCDILKEIQAYNNNVYQSNINIQR